MFDASIQLLQANPALFVGVCGVLGLMVGSFLNVVIHRLPLMMERQWKEQCHEILELPPGEQAEQFDLVQPRSRCPKCGHRITALENIPVISYLFLRGKCSGCATPISMRYPLVELVTALLSMLVAWHFGFGWQAGAALLFTWCMIPLTGIDFDHQLLPDTITLPLLWLGLVLSLVPVFVDSHASLIGAAAGYLSLWIVYQLFRLLTGREGMGFGDFKLLAAIGAWTGWKLLPAVILLSSAVGAVVGILLIVLRGRDRQIPIPFGPYLATAGLITLLWGNELNEAWLRWLGV